MRRPHVLLAIALFTVTTASSARALPVGFVVDPFQSSLTATLENLVADSQPVIASGSLSADVGLGVDATFGLVATSLRLDGGALGFSDTVLSLTVPGAIALDAATNGLGADLSSPVLAGTATAPGTSLFDLVGSTLTLDAGDISAIGSVLSTPVDIALDFGATPLPFAFDPGHVAELVAEDLGSDQVGLTLTLPVDVSLSFVASGIETTLSLGGDVVMTGTTAIPEPQTGLLLAFALICLSAARRAHRRS